MPPSDFSLLKNLRAKTNWRLWNSCRNFTAK